MSTAPSEQRPIPSDARLVWMASERAAPLFRTLDRAGAFGPLVVLLAILPAAVVMLTATCSEEDAAVALLALQSVGIPLPDQIAPIVREELAGVSLRPAALGIIGGALRAFGATWPSGILAASILGGMSLIAALWWFVQTLGQRRLAFWVVLLAAFHPAMIRLLNCPVPVSLALAGVVSALGAYLGLSSSVPSPRAPRMIWRVAVLAGGIAIAMVIVGPLAFYGLVVIVIDAFGCWLFIPGDTTGRTRSPRAALTPRSLLGLRLLGAGLGFVLWLVVDGVFPASHWNISAGRLSEVARQESWFTFDSLWSLPEIAIGPLWGLALIGIWRLGRLTKRPSGNRRRASARLLLTWILAAILLVIWFSPVSLSQSAFDPTTRFVAASAVLPLLIAAAFAIEEAARRTVSGAWIVLAILLPVAIRVGEWIAIISLESPWRWLVICVVILGVGWIGYTILRAIIPAATQRRVMLMGIILFAVGLTAADGMRLVFRENWPRDDMDRLLVQLREAQPRDGVAVLAGGAPPVRLIFAVRGVYLHTPMEIAPSWEEAAERLDLRGAEGRRLAVAWDMGESLGVASPAPIQPTGEPLLFEDRPLLIYVTGKPALVSKVNRD